ncbi:MAG TPA: hypothetical protein VM616_08185 [Gammaproteobacteria bacterium]|nr:hypothetical protein [Gammaproteobacteria bacterium]
MESQLRFTALAIAGVLLLAACAETPTLVRADRPHGAIAAPSAPEDDRVGAVVLISIDDEDLQSTYSGPAHVHDRDARDQRATLDYTNTFIVSPGRHIVRAAAIIDERYQPVAPDSTYYTRTYTADDIGTVELNVGEGKIYYIGAALEPGQPGEWRPVVYAQGDITDYEIPSTQR